MKLKEAAAYLSFVVHIALVLVETLFRQQIAMPMMKEKLLKSFLRKVRIRILTPSCTTRMWNPQFSFAFSIFNCWFTDVFLPLFC